MSGFVVSSLNLYFTSFAATLLLHKLDVGEIQINESLQS